MFRKFFLLLSGMVCAASIIYAQLQPCSTDERYHELLKQYPYLADYEEQFEAQLASLTGARTTASTDTVIYDIPFVLHVVHDYGTENLSDDDLYIAFSYWAKVYMKQNGDTASVI